MVLVKIRNRKMASDEKHLPHKVGLNFLIVVLLGMGIKFGLLGLKVGKKFHIAISSLLKSA
jgi:hypothetical protein